MNTKSNHKNGFVPYEGSITEGLHKAGPAACLLVFPPSVAKPDDKCPRCNGAVAEHASWNGPTGTVDAD